MSTSGPMPNTPRTDGDAFRFLVGGSLLGVIVVAYTVGIYLMVGGRPAAFKRLPWILALGATRIVAISVGVLNSASRTDLRNLTMAALFVSSLLILISRPGGSGRPGTILLGVFLVLAALPVIYFALS